MRLIDPNKPLLEYTTLLISMVAFLFAWKQIKLNRRATKAKFIYDLNQNLQTFGPCIRNLEAYRDRLFRNQQLGSTPAKEAINLDIEARTTYTENGWDVRDILRYFESIMLMLEINAIQDEDIFPLIGYRLVTVLNSPIIQREFLYRRAGEENKKYSVEPRYSFVAVFAFYERFMQYNKTRFDAKNSYVLTGDLLESFRFVWKYDLRTSYTHILLPVEPIADNTNPNRRAKEVKKITPAQRKRDLQKAEYADQIANYRKSLETRKAEKRSINDLTPYEKAIRIYQTHKPAYRKSLWWKISDSVGRLFE